MALDGFFLFGIAKVEPEPQHDSLETPTTKVTPSPSPFKETEASRVKSIMESAKLRQEEFARLLEEHEQIVNEINRVETSISSSQTSLRQEQENK